MKLLDCTLRDGGYINNWNFGKDNIQYIGNKLSQANVDFIEVGYLNKNSSSSDFSTKVNDLNCIKLDTRKTKLIMINYGDYNVNDLPNYSSNTEIQGIRLAFHKKNMKDALQDCKIIKKKGYMLFIQPMLSINYDEDEFIDLINYVNEIEPYAFYIVDSFGCMNAYDIKKYCKIVSSNLNKNINVGFHSHNNLQLSIYNTDLFLKILSPKYNIIIDSSVYGMGRGAGNLPTELFIQHFDYKNIYNIVPILDVIEHVLMAIKQEKPWGYSIEYYISARYKCHPNYAKYLVDKKMINVVDIESIIKQIPCKKRNSFDKEYIETLYEQFQSNPYDDTLSYEFVNKFFNNKKILLIGTGSSVIEKKDYIKKFQKENDLITIFINHNIDDLKCDYIFFGNKNRYELYENEIQDKSVIVTSNVSDNCSKNIVFDYKKSIVNIYENIDNSLLMFLNIVKQIKIEKIYLAGFDGFDIDIEKNHYDNKLFYSIDKKHARELNENVKKNLQYFNKNMNLEFITKSKYSEVIK